MALYYFYIPPFEDLSDSQKEAVNDPSPIALRGGPGTGKSVVSIWRHLINFTREKPINSQLLTFTTTLAYYLKKCCEERSLESSKNVMSTKKWFHRFGRQKVDELIIDEAQDLPVEFNRQLFSYGEKVTYGADNQQIGRECKTSLGEFDVGKCSPEQELEELTLNGPIIHELNVNYRSTLNIMLFAKNYFVESFVPQEILESLAGKKGDLPRLLISKGDLSKKNAAIIDIINQFNNEATNIGILQPFDQNAPRGDKSLTAKYYYDLLVENGIDCSYFGHNEHNGVGITEIKNVHCTPFKSAKGLEFDVVIIPNINLAHTKFDVVDWNNFYVGVTRAKSQLILLSDVDLPQISNFVETVQL